MVFNTTALRNDSTWFGTARAIRLLPIGSTDSVRQINIHIATDILFPGRDMPDSAFPYTATGCKGDCRQSQILSFYNIPLKRGRSSIGKIDKKRTIENERTSYWLVGYSGGAYKRYLFKGRKPGWIRVTSYDKYSKVVEGRFAVWLDEDLSLTSRLINEIKPLVKFSKGLFRVKLTDVKVE